MDRKLRSYDNKSQLRSSLQLHWIGILTLKWNPTSEHFSLLRGRTENIENLLGNVYEHKSKLWHQCFLQPNVFIFFIFYEIFFSFFSIEEGIHRAWTPSQVCSCWSCSAASPMDSELCIWCLWKQQQKDKTPSGQGNLEDHIQVTHGLREHIY